MRPGNERADFINYKNPGIFMITINRNNDYKLPFSYLKEYENCTEPSDMVKARLTKIGFVIWESLEDLKISNKKIGIIQHVIMPDHIHFIINIKEKMDEDLGYVIGRLKRTIFHKAQERNVISFEISQIFSEGFNDLYLKYRIRLGNLINYIRKNPYQLWIRLKNPDYFERMNNICINNCNCRLYGNIRLLENPIKEAVINHGRYSESERLKLKKLWRYTFCNGGIIVSPFINDLEKEIFKEALEKDGKIILISEIGYDQRQKPKGRLFRACEKGNLLIVTPEIYLQTSKSKQKLGWKDFHFLNEIAEKIKEEENILGY